jgi:hypothetical protein
MKTIYTNQANRRTRAAPLAVVIATSERLFGSHEVELSEEPEKMTRYAAQNKSGDSTNEPTAPELPSPISPNLGDNASDTSSDETRAGPADDPGSLPR